MTMASNRMDDTNTHTNNNIPREPAPVAAGREIPQRTGNGNVEVRQRTRSSGCGSTTATESTSSATAKATPYPPLPTNRSRLDSKDIPRTYSGLYGSGGELTEHQTRTSDLLPFELSRNVNTEWILNSSNNQSKHKKGGSDSNLFLRSCSSGKVLLTTYIFFIILIQISILLLPLPFGISSIQTSFTCTNVIHGLLSLLFLHWIKGSPNFYEQGELNGMTFWEQLSSSPSVCNTSHEKRINVNKVLVIMPTLLCYAGCHFSEYDRFLCSINLVVWATLVIAKMDGMNGVRLWGINATIGIDDDTRKCD